MIDINLPAINTVSSVNTNKTPSRENNGMVISTNNCISDSSNNSISTVNSIQHDAGVSLANSLSQPKPKNLVPCPFLRRRGYCLKGSRFDKILLVPTRFHIYRHLIAAKIPCPLNLLFFPDEISLVFSPVPPPHTPLLLPPPSTAPTLILPPVTIPTSVDVDTNDQTSNLLNNKSPCTNEMFDKNFYMPRLLLTNVRSLIPKIEELEVVANVNDADIICITEAWLTPNIPDSALSYSNFVLFRNDRTVSIGGGVCILVNKNIFCKRLTEFENPNIESLWLSLRPRRLPRSISIILVAVVYHSTSSGAPESYELYNHIQCNF